MIRKICLFIITITLFSFEIHSEYIEKEYRGGKRDRTLVGTVYFKAGSYKITENGRRQARKIAQVLDIYDTYQKNRRIKVVGYADKMGDSDLNLHLGLARAERVANMLEGYGVSMRLAKIASYGESHTLFADSHYRKAEVWLEKSSWSMLGHKTFLYIVIGFFILIAIAFVSYWLSREGDRA